MRPLILRMADEGHIFYEQNTGLVCENPVSAMSPDYGMIAAFWVLLDLKKAMLYPVDNEFTKLKFYFRDEVFEIVYIAPGQEERMNQTFSKISAGNINRLIVIESQNQAVNVSIERTVAFCLVDKNGVVSYFSK